MLKRKKFLALFFSITCLSCLAVVAAFKGQKSSNLIAATNEIETETGVTLSKGSYASFATVENWESKTLVFDIKTDGTSAKFQICNSGDKSTGLLRSGNKSDADKTASYCSIENNKYGQTGESYWFENSVETLSDGWYRWYVTLSILKTGTAGGEAASRLYCQTGSNVQIKNLKFLDGDIAYGNQKFIHLPTTFNNWKDTTLQLDVNYPTGTQRRFQIVNTSGSGVSGIVCLTTTSTKVQSVTDGSYVEIGVPTYLGNNWYRHTIDLSKLQIRSGKTGAEDINQIKNLPDVADPSDLQIRNVKVGSDIYDPSTVAQTTISSEYTSLPTTIVADDWYADSAKDYNLLFDVYGLPLNSFEFSFGTYSTSFASKTTKFKFYENGQIKCTEGTNSGNVIGSYTESSNGWFNVSINLYSLKNNNNSDLNAISTQNLSSNTIYIKNLSLDKTYNPESDADYILKAGENTTIPNMTYWGLRTISFEVYHESLDTTGSPQFLLCEKDSNSYLSGFFGYTNEPGSLGLYFRTSTTGYWAQSSNQPVFVSDGWYRWTLNLMELGTSNDNADFATRVKTVGSIYNRGSNDVYIRNVTEVSIYDPSANCDMTWVNNNNTFNDSTSVKDWAVRDTTITFKMFGMPSSSFSLSCASEKANESAAITKDNRISYKSKTSVTDSTKNAGNMVDDNGNVVGSFSPLAGDDLGWYSITIQVNKLAYGYNNDNRSFRYVRILGDQTNYYVKDFTVTQGDVNYDKCLYVDSDNEVGGFIDLISPMKLWKANTLTFKTYGPLYPNIALSDGLNLTSTNGDGNLSSNFSINSKNNTVVFDTTELGTYTELTGDEAGWYRWTIDLTKLPATNNFKGFEDATYLYVKSSGAKFTSFFFKDIEFSTMVTEGAGVRLVAPQGLRFVFSVNDSTLNLINTVQGITDLEIGALIIPSALLDSSKDGYDLTKDTESVASVIAQNYLNEDTHTFTAVLSGIPESFYDKDITSRGYISFTYNSTKYYTYSNPITRSFEGVAKSAIADNKDTADDEYCNHVTADGETYFYSTYTQDEIDFLNTLIVNKDSNTNLKPARRTSVASSVSKPNNSILSFIHNLLVVKYNGITKLYKQLWKSTYLIWVGIKHTLLV